MDQRGGGGDLVLGGSNEGEVLCAAPLLPPLSFSIPE